MPMIWAEWDFLVLRPPTILGQESLENCNHVDIAFKMIRFIEAQCILFSTCRPQMSKVNAGREPTSHGGKIVVRSHAEAACAEAHAVCFRRNGCEQSRVVLLRRGDARQAEKRPWRIVRMESELD